MGRNVQRSNKKKVSKFREIIKIPTEWKQRHPHQRMSLWNLRTLEIKRSKKFPWKGGSLESYLHNWFYKINITTPISDNRIYWGKDIKILREIYFLHRINSISVRIK